MTENIRFIRYLIAGGYNTLFGFLVFTGLYFLLEDVLHYLVISVITQIIAITNAYIVYRMFVFKSKGRVAREYVRVYMVYGFTFVLSLLLLALQVELFGMHPVVAQFFVIAVTAIVSYLSHSRFTFKPETSD